MGEHQRNRFYGYHNMLVCKMVLQVAARAVREGLRGLRAVLFS